MARVLALEASAETNPKRKKKKENQLVVGSQSHVNCDIGIQAYTLMANEVRH